MGRYEIAIGIPIKPKPKPKLPKAQIESLIGRLITVDPNGRVKLAGDGDQVMGKIAGADTEAASDPCWYISFNGQGVFSVKPSSCLGPLKGTAC